MQKRHSTVLKALAGLAFGLALTATSAQAQAQACVLNKGVYLAKMAIWIGTRQPDYSFSYTKHTDYSDSYSNPNWRCQSLTTVPDGGKFLVKVQPGGGIVVTCDKENFPTRSAANTSTIYYKATQGTLNALCNLTSERP